mgnify:CR=1 FL=1
MMKGTLLAEIRDTAMHHGVPILVLIGLVFAYHAPILLSGSTYYTDDILYQHFPSFVFASRRLQAGDIPLWNPHQFSGFPYLADSVSQLLYPPLWLLLLVGPSHVMVFILLHYVLAALAFYGAAPNLGINSREARLGASVVFMLSGFLLRQTSNLVNLCAYAWIPLAVVFATESAARPSIASGLKMGAVLALQVLSGGVQIALGTFYLTVAYVLVRSIGRGLKEDTGWRMLAGRIGRVALGGIVGLSLAAAQILPSWEFARLSVRAQASSYEWASSYSLGPSRLLSFLVPSLWSDPISWTVAAQVGDGRLGYAGVCTIALVVLSSLIFRRESRLRFFLLAGLAFLALSLGRYTPLHRFAYTVLPGFQMLRTPIRYLSLYLFCVSVVAGLVLNWLQGLERSEVLPLALASVALMTVVMGAAVLLRPKNLWSVASRPAAFLGLLALSSLAYRGRMIPRGSLTLSLLCLIVVDLFAFGRQHRLPVAPKRVFELEPLQAAGSWIEDQQTDEVFRVYWPNDLEVDVDGVHYEARAPLAAVWNIHGVEGYSQLKPALYEQFWQDLPRGRALELLNARYAISDAAEGRVPEESLVLSSSELSVYRTDAYLPRAFVVPRCRAVEIEEALDIMAQASFDPAEVALISEGASSHLPAAWPEEASGHVEVISYSPESIELSAHLPYEGVLVLSEPYFPGWRCQVNGRIADVRRADVILRAVVLPAGTHTVTFTYSPASVRIGALVSLAALLLSAVVCIREPRS